MSISIKLATSENIKGVSELFNLYRVFYKQTSDLDLATRFITERINNNESVIYLAQDSAGNYLGFTQLYPTFSSVSAKKSWVLNDLFVTENHRKLGIAKQLMSAAKKLAVETSANGISLETSENNVHAQALYEALGYVKEMGAYHYFLSTSAV